MNKAKFVERKKGIKIAKSPEGRVAYDAASFNKEVFFLNPFYSDRSIQIPVPGQNCLFSNSLEAIWQGLKIVGGQMDLDMFLTEPRKRPNTKERRELTAQGQYSYQDSRFQYGTEELDLITARKVIYVPSYRFLFDNFVPTEFKEQVKSQLKDGKDVYFYDWDDNPDIDNPNESFAHASLLVDLVNEYTHDDEVVFSIKDIATSNPLELKPPYEGQVFDYAGRLEIYVDQEILKHAKPIKTSIIATSARSQKRYLLPENDTITSTFHNETLTVKHKPGSKIISNLKKLKWAFSDLTSRNLTHTDIQDDFKLPESYDLFDSVDYDTHPDANFSYRRVGDGSYILTIKDNWHNNHRYRLFTENGTMSEDYNSYCRFRSVNE